MIDFLVVIVVLFAVVLVVSAPLRRARRPEPHGTTELADLEAAREAKYREIRDAELDHRTGKLSEADYEVLDQSLRAEAIEILRSIDRERERMGEPVSDVGERERMGEPTKATSASAE